MDYIELTCKITPYDIEISEILTAQLGELGFESFIEQADSLQAYIQHSDFDEKKIKAFFTDYKSESKIEFSHKLIKEENWNETWEKNYFEPIIIDNQCVIRSSFHPEFPGIEYSITIDPKMAFGTGHHETTSLMVREILNLQLDKMTILDMGCGTGILAILCALKGAENITAVDNDVWSYRNTLENKELNQVQNIVAIHGDVKSIDGLKFDLIIANINKNVLLSDIPNYAICLKEGACILLSGFYQNDFEDINQVAVKSGLKFQKVEEINNWVMLKYSK
jgi:ribosomal protein L11 methyltransferase